MGSGNFGSLVHRGQLILLRTLGLYLGDMDSQPQRGMALVKILVPVALVVVLIAGLYYLFIDPLTSRLAQARIGEVMSGTPPEDLQEAHFLLTPSNGGGIYSESGIDYEEYAKDGSIVADITHAEASFAKLAYAPDGTTSKISVNGATIIASPTIKRSLALSPNGTYIAYAEKEIGTEPYQHASWRVQVIEIATGNRTEYDGFAVVFVGDEEMLVAKVDGVYAVHHSSKEEQKVIDKLFPAPHQTYVAVSNTHDTFSWTENVEGIKHTKTYSVRFAPEWFVSELGSFDEVAGSIAVTQDHLYVLSPKGESVELRQYPVTGGESEMIRTFPKILSVNKLLP